MPGFASLDDEFGDIVPREWNETEFKFSDEALAELKAVADEDTRVRLFLDDAQARAYLTEFIEQLAVEAKENDKTILMPKDIMIMKNRDGKYTVKQVEPEAPKPEPKPLVGRAANVLDGREV